MSGVQFNPLDKRRLAESVARALLETGLVPLPEITDFPGAGIYALYYGGTFPDYASIVLPNDREPPIYVGKAIPKGGRKGGWGLGIDPGNVLSRRLKEHKSSLEACVNLDVADFYARYLVVDDVWIPLAESLLVEWYAPIWNTILDGFGNHDPGSGRRAGQRPAWDTMHPGREWANRLQPNARTKDQWANLVQRALSGDQTVPRLGPVEAVLSEESGED